jgi:citrate lyase subunit beta/citryl-CoA lyase
VRWACSAGRRSIPGNWRRSRRAYLPTAQETARAAEVLAAARLDSGALALPDGRFVDPAVVEGARRVLALAGKSAV